MSHHATCCCRSCGSGETNADPARREEAARRAGAASKQTAEELLAQLRSPRFEHVTVSWWDKLIQLGPQWIIGWRRRHGDATSNRRTVGGATLAEAVAAAIAWEDANDRDEPEHAE